MVGGGQDREVPSFVLCTLVFGRWFLAFEIRGIVVIGALTQKTKDQKPETGLLKCLVRLFQMTHEKSIFFRTTAATSLPFSPHT